MPCYPTSLIKYTAYLAFNCKCTFWKKILFLLFLFLLSKSVSFSPSWPAQDPAPSCTHGHRGSPPWSSVLQTVSCLVLWWQGWNVACRALKRPGELCKLCWPRVLTVWWSPASLKLALGLAGQHGMFLLLLHPIASCKMPCKPWAWQGLALSHLLPYLLLELKALWRCLWGL